MSEIRNEITGQHAQLRELLSEIEGLAERFEVSEESDAKIGRELHDRGRLLFEQFGAHMESEQTLLEPVFRKSGEEGKRLAKRMQTEHHEQRELLRYLTERLAQHPEPTILIARELQHFAGFLRYEMAHEEETLLALPALKGADD